MTRTFVALLIPEAWTAYLRAVGAELGGRMSGLSWVKPENIHLTIRFLGGLTDPEVERARESVRRSGASLTAPVARLGRLGAFPRPERPRVVWVGLAQGDPETIAVARVVNQALDQDGFEREEKPFRSHLTLARVREGSRGLGDLTRILLPESPPAEPLRRLAVMKSDLHPKGARYTVLEELRLLEPAS